MLNSCIQTDGFNAHITEIASQLFYHPHQFTSTNATCAILQYKIQNCISLVCRCGCESKNMLETLCIFYLSFLKVAATAPRLTDDNFYIYVIWYTCVYPNIRNDIFALHVVNKSFYFLKCILRVCILCGFFIQHSFVRLYSLYFIVSWLGKFKVRAGDDSFNIK